jgi:hypothetical protein
MAINTRNAAINHAKFVVEDLRKDKALPFTDVLSVEVISKHTENISYRERIFSPLMTIFTFLSQVISQDQSCQGALAQTIAFLAGNNMEVPSANTAAYCKARDRLPEETISGLAKECGQELEVKLTEERMWNGMRVKLVDGSTISMPDTVENQTIYPQPSSQKEGVGFPIARVVALVSWATGAVLDFAVGPYAGKGTGEHALLRQILHNFKLGDIVLGDNYYASFFFDSDAYEHGCRSSFPDS